METCKIHFRKLPKKGAAFTSLKDCLDELCSPFGDVVSISVLHGRGQALVEFSSHDAVVRFMSAHPQNSVDHPTWRSGAIIEMSRNSCRHECSGIAEPQHVQLDGLEHDGKVRLEVERSLNALIRNIVTADSRNRHEQRLERKRRHKLLVKSTTTPHNTTSTTCTTEAKRPKSENSNKSEEFCWNFVVSGGSFCPLGEACHRRHEMRPVIELPLAFRAFEVEDFFPIRREVREFFTRHSLCSF